MIELRDISYTFPQASSPVLHNLSFTIRDKRIGIIGPNGCGKTTLLHFMVGLLKSLSGHHLPRLGFSQPYHLHPVQNRPWSYPPV